MTDLKKQIENFSDASKFIGPEGVHFNVAERITRQIETIEDLEAFFESEGSQKPEYFNDRAGWKFSEEKPEFVPLDLVVGGSGGARYDGTFLVYQKGEGSEGKGRQHVLEIAKSYAGGRNLDSNKPQEFYEYQGKYYVTRGRHSVAALKALGVDRIPAFVQHVLE